MKKFLLAFAAAALVFGLAAAETYQQAYGKMNALRGKGKRKEALAAAERAVKLAKKDNEKAQATFMCGVLNCEMRQYDKGIATLKEAMKFYKTPFSKISCQFHIAFYLSQNQKEAEALAAFKQTIAYGKGRKSNYAARAYALIPRSLYRLKKYKEALAAAREAQEKVNDPDELLHVYVAVYDSAIALKDQKSAGEAIENLLKLKCKYPHSRFTIARYAYTWYRRNRQFDKALEQTKKIAAEKKLSKHLQLHSNYYAALVLANMGKNKEAIAQWKILQNSGDRHFKAMADKKFKTLKK